MSGPPRIPTAILTQRESAKHNKGRLDAQGRGAEPVPEGELGPPPKHFDKLQKECWTELATQCCKGVMTSSDRASIEQGALLLAESRFCTMNGLTMRIEKVGRLMAILCEFGMTPASRSKVAVAKKNPSNAFGGVAKNKDAPNPSPKPAAKKPATKPGSAVTLQ